ncbi:MAG: 1-deoxy-D-xylulose-5-phosphate synthase [Tannerellaceae bacterium]|jgi:1-deoxy-D-xylulose-5-phosphate synthase|nr:1-deoxy-D-xylulose-5-phosphate synthase [Tannerellaceae bacterium]
MTEHQKEVKLNSINTPDDLRVLPQSDLQNICAELRQYIIDVLSENPGHLGASLGTVEMTVALHYVFNTPYDRIIWDVGHQAYGHKILTGRRDVFPTLRKYKGISGFPSPAESEYDSFIAGHASTSISAALGMSVASSLKSEERHVIAVIGDGAMTGGLAFEGLNNVSINPNNLLIILNDNNMAIDGNVGALSEYLVNITTSYPYNKLRYDVYRGLRKIKLINDNRKGLILRFNNSLKALLTSQHNLFEGFSIRYFGPTDGHDVEGIIRILNDIKSMKGPKLLHLRTKKGKGFKPAEESAVEWHAPGKFNKKTGERILVNENLEQPQLYQDVFGHTLVELASTNDKVVGITPAMPTGCSMIHLMKAYPHRAFDVGIAEGHAATFSAGLAKEGMIPFCNIYSSFMQRAYDNLIHDIAIQQLHVILCLDRAGLVGEDGATHHGIFDLAYLRPIPNLIISSPMNEWHLRNLMYTACYGTSAPFVIRYPRGKGEQKDWRNDMQLLPIGKGRKLADGSDIAILSIGPIGNEVTKAISLLNGKASIAHYDMIYLKPIDEALLHEIGKQHTHIITLENGVRNGGLGSAVIEFMSDHNYHPHILRLGIPDTFVEHGTIPELFRLYGLDAEHIAKTIIEEIN